MNYVNCQTIFVIFLSLKKNQKLKKCPKASRNYPEGGAATLLEARGLEVSFAHFLCSLRILVNCSKSASTA